MTHPSRESPLRRHQAQCWARRITGPRLPTWMVVIPTSRPTRILLSWREATCGSSSFMKPATRWLMSTCQSGPSRWLSCPQGPAPSDTNWVRTRTVACWYWRVQPRPLLSSSSSSSLSRVGLWEGGGAALRGGLASQACRHRVLSLQHPAAPAGAAGAHRSTEHQSCPS